MASYIVRVSKHICALSYFVLWQKEKADLEKLKLILKPEEMSATVNLQTPHEHMQHLDQLYQELETHYKKTIERIAATWKGQFI